MTVSDRQLWDGARDVRQYWVARGERYVTVPLPALTAEIYAEYRRTGERARFEAAYHRRRQIVTTLVLAEGFENTGRFVARLLEAVTELCDEPTWVLPAHEDQPLDMFAAETGNLLAWTLYLFADVPAVARSTALPGIREAVRRRVIDPYLDRDDCWWMKVDGEQVTNWTPWCTSNCLGTALLLEPHPDRRWQALEKSCRLLDGFLAAHADDGGCDEGPTYWNFAAGCLFDALEMLHEASHGALDLFDHPVVRNIGEYICKVHVHELYFVNFADSLPQVPIDAALMYRYGKRIGNAHMQALGARLYRLLDRYDPEDTLRLKLYRALATLADWPALRARADPTSAPRDAYLPKLQVMVARETERPGEGLVLAVKGGHNDEGHNHNDVGNVVVYLDGRPVLIDVGMTEYSKKSFSDERYDIWAMQSAFHNVPLVNDCMQASGGTFGARDARFAADEEGTRLVLDIAGAYPPHAGLERWDRVCTLSRRDGRVTIADRFRFRRDDNRCELRFLSCCRPSRAGGGLALALESGRCVLLATTPAPTRVTVHAFALRDRQLRYIWGEAVYQLRLHFEHLPRVGECSTTIGREGAAGAFAPEDALALLPGELP